MMAHAVTNAKANVIFISCLDPDFLFRNDATNGPLKSKHSASVKSIGERSQDPALSNGYPLYATPLGPVYKGMRGISEVPLLPVICESYSFITIVFPLESRQSLHTPRRVVIVWKQGA